MNDGLPPIRTLFLMLDCELPKTGTAQGIWRNMVALSKLGPMAVYSVGWNEYPEPMLPGVERWIHVDKYHEPDRPRWAQNVERAVRLVIPPAYPYVHLGLEQRMHRQLSRFIADFKPTVAVLDHWLNAVIPPPLRGGDFPVVVASHDVEWQLLKDVTAGKAPPLKRLRGDLEVVYVRRLERKLYRDADRVWAVSEGDRQEIRRFTGPTCEVSVLPAVTDVDRYETVRRATMDPSRPRSRNGPTLIYAGGYQWHPNVEAAELLIDEIYPKVRAAYPGTRLFCVGKDPSSAMLAASRNDPNVIVTGEVEDVRPYLAESDIVTVPLLLGGGMRIKLLEAFACGLPAVSTTKGAEGLKVADGRELLIRDGVENFVSGVIELWENPQRARAFADNGLDFVRREHSMETMDARLRAELREIMAARRARR